MKGEEDWDGLELEELLSQVSVRMSAIKRIEQANKPLTKTMLTDDLVRLQSHIARRQAWRVHQVREALGCTVEQAKIALDRSGWRVDLAINEHVRRKAGL